MASRKLTDLPPTLQPIAAQFLERCRAAAGVIGEDLGLEWAGRWVSMREYQHFQLKG